MPWIVHIGLPLALPWLTADEATKIAARLLDLQHRMEAAGYQYTVLHASPTEGLADFRIRLRTQPCDLVVIGGGVAADAKLSAFRQQIIDAVTEEAPHTKVVEFDHSVELPVLVARALRPV